MAIWSFLTFLPHKMREVGSNQVYNVHHDANCVSLRTIQTLCSYVPSLRTCEPNRLTDLQFEISLVSCGSIT